VRHLCVTGGAQRIRLESRLSQNDVALEVGTTGSVVSMWERALATPRNGFALRYARLLRALDAELARTKAAMAAQPSMIFAPDDVAMASLTGSAARRDAGVGE
jgi:transcriptional regulator with XRE-family HTH domain